MEFILHRQIKYQKVLASNRYIKKRYQIINNLLKKKYTIFKNTNYIKDKIKNNTIFTNQFLAQNLNYKNKTNLKILLRLYKKFNFSMQLKAKYNRKLIKCSNKETHFSSYIFLGYHVLNLKQVNEIQKLNFLLKINDIALINLNNKFIDKIIFYVKHNFKQEKKLIKKYAKKFLSYSN